ncbi:hypothetical protein CIC12_03105 [Burkholderia sp. SG-MS1]|nr:hypothetical protein [Paraburkholderia sp. SG-MS1]
MGIRHAGAPHGENGRPLMHEARRVAADAAVSSADVVRIAHAALVVAEPNDPLQSVGPATH